MRTGKAKRQASQPGAGTLSRMMSVIGMFAVAIFLASAFTPFANVLGSWTSVRGELGPADAIVVLGAGGPTPPGILDGSSSRKTLYGIRLYHNGLAPLLVLSGAPDDGEQREEVSLRVDLARGHGVPAQAVVARTGPRAGAQPTTHGEALHVRSRLAERGVRTVVLVTDSQHMRRAQRVYERVGFAVMPAPIDEISLDATAPEARLRLVRWIGEEFLAKLYYRVAGYI